MSKKNNVNIICEIGINHDGSLKKAIEMIKVSAECGVDTCKFQLLKATEMYTPNSGIYENASGKFDIYKVVKDNEMGDDWLPVLIEECKKNGVEFLTTVYDLVGFEEIIKYHPRFLKLASYEISFVSLSNAIGGENIPLIISSAGSNLGDIEEAIKAYGSEENLTIMHCNGKYPAPRKMINMGVLNTFKLAFPNSKIGFSDHTEDPVEAPVAAVALGASVIEKHFTLDKKSPGPDHSFAVDPRGLKSMVDAIRFAENKISIGDKIEVDPIVYGTTKKITQPEEEYIRNFGYRYLYAAKDILEGELFTLSNLKVLRAGQLEKGFHPRELVKIINKKSPCFIRQGSPVNFTTLLG